jgi:hypothetical protein
MAAKKISEIDAYYFNFHIPATFAEYLNDVEKHSYEKLTEDWWRSMAEEYVPQINADDANIEEIKKAIFDKAMAHFPEKFLTEAQNKELLELVGEAIQAFIDRFKRVCYCGDRLCEFDCGVQSCGMCIDCCRCPSYW